MKRQIITTALLLSASPLFAQTYGGTGTGLDKLDEQQVMAALASNGMESLLKRDFTNFNVPDNQKDQILTLIELQQLLGSNLSTAGRRALAVKVAKGLDGLMAKATDPDALMIQANQLYNGGVGPTLNELEFFGENPRSQSELNPVAVTDKKMYDKVAELDAAKRAKIAAGVNQQNLAQKRPLMLAARQQQEFARFLSMTATYPVCISLPKGDPDRKKQANDDILALHEFDNANSGIQSGVRLLIGKLQLAASDYKTAAATFDSIISGKDIKPPPGALDQNYARYFKLVTMIEQNQLPQVEKEIPDLENWQTANLYPVLTNANDQDTIRASMAMLKFRELVAEADITNDKDLHKAKNDAAIDVLSKLIKDQPQRKDIVFDQLVARIEGNDYGSMNPLVLQAMQDQGIDELRKPEAAPIDTRKLNRAIDASKELVTRNSAAGGDAKVASQSSYFLGYAYDRLKQGKDAAAAFMDYAEKYTADMDKATDALSHANKWIFDLHKTNAEDADTRKLYDRFLPLAINPPYNQKVFAFTYAAMLLGEAKNQEAITYFSQVPDTSKNHPDAKYFIFSAQFNLTKDPTLVGDAHAKAVQQTLDDAKVVDEMLPNAPAAEKTKYANWVVAADLIAAKLTRAELNQPDRALEILNGFEERVAAAKDPAQAHSEAQSSRVMSYLAAKKSDQAVKTLLDLMQSDPARGEDLMLDVLHAVDQDENDAKDIPTKRALALSKAVLSGVVVDHYSKSKDPQDQAKLPTFKIFDADSKREAAELDDNAETKKTNLDAALKGYQAMFNEYKSDPKQESLANQAQLGIGLTQYDIGNFKEAIESLSPLVNNKKIGEPKMTINHGGVEETVENPEYWEINYKLLRSIVEVYKKTTPKTAESANKLEDANNYIGRLFFFNKANTGGKTYHDDFIKLKTEISTLKGSAPATQKAT